MASAPSHEVIDTDLFFSEWGIVGAPHLESVHPDDLIEAAAADEIALIP